MPTTPPAADLRLLAPAFAARFAVIAAALAALIARAFLRQPGLAPLILPLCRRLGRNARRLAAHMARFAAGQPPLHHRPGATGGPKPPIPTTRAWLVRVLHHDAAGFASQLAHLLAEPGVSDLLAASPATTRILRPLCRMLGVSWGDSCASSRIESRPAALRAVGCDRCAPSRTKSPATALPAVAPRAPVVFAPTNPERPPPSLHTPPCPHVGWPWFPRPGAKPA